VENTHPLLGVTSSKSGALEAAFLAATNEVQATNAVFGGPSFLGSDFPSASDPSAAPPEETLFTTVPDGPGAKVWSFNAATSELTISLPKPGGGSVPAAFVLDGTQNALDLVTGTPNQAQVVRLYFSN
jgi:hypothetical protein